MYTEEYILLEKKFHVLGKTGFSKNECFMYMGNHVLIKIMFNDFGENIFV